jgi:hypothetical protein
MPNIKALPSGRKSCAECGWLSHHWNVFELEPGGRYARSFATSCQNTHEWCGLKCFWIDGKEKKECASGYMLMPKKMRWTWLTKIN